jgi:hypothetical protein
VCFSTFYHTLQDIAKALHVNQAASTTVPVLHINGYAETLQLLIAATVSHSAHLSSTKPTATAQAATAEAGDDKADATGGYAAKWHQTAAAAVGVTSPSHKEHSFNSQHIAAAFGELMTDVTKEEAHMAQWCSTLILCRQLGRALLGLNSSVNSLLPVLPGNNNSSK